MDNGYIKERLIYYFETIVGIKYNDIFVNDDIDILSYNGISPAEVVWVIKLVLNDIRRGHKNVQPFEGIVSLNNIIRFISSVT